MKNQLEFARSMIMTQVEGLMTLLENLDEKFNEALDLLLESRGKIVVTGVGKSGFVGRKMSATLSSVGIPSFFLSPLDALHGDLGAIDAGDVVVLISHSGNTQELIPLVDVFREREIKVILISGNNSSPLADRSDITLPTYIVQEACPFGIVPTTSTTAALVLADALSICAAHKKGFSIKNFHKNHPQGHLSSRIQNLKVSSGRIPA